jgi:hypothetical protein
MRVPGLRSCLALALLAEAAVPSGGAEAKLKASAALTFDRFGDAAAIDGDTAVVGAPHDNIGSVSDQGSASVFVRSGSSWSALVKLKASDGKAYDRLGSAVAISGDRIIVGAAGDNHGGNPDAGSAYVFERTGTVWIEQAKLIASDAAAGDLFGWGVAIAGDTAIVGAPIDTHSGLFEAGSAYVFERVAGTWIQKAKLISPAPMYRDRMGFSVAIDGDTAICGSPHAQIGGPADAGNAQVFVRVGALWNHHWVLQPSDGVALDEFGTSVSISGDSVAVGARLDDHTPGMFGSPNGQGSAYVFLRTASTWSQQAKVTAASPTARDLFGASVSIRGDRLAVGAPAGDAWSDGEPGQAFLFERSGTTWSSASPLAPAGVKDGDTYGRAVGLSASAVVVGAPTDLHAAGLPGTQGGQGSAYVFRLEAPPAEPYCTGGTSGGGCVASLGASGTASASAASGFVLTATGVEGAKDGLFFYGAGGRQASAWGNGTSLQCVVTPVKRGGLLTGSGTAGQCDGSFTQDLNARWCPACPKWKHNPAPCTWMQAQLWYRDPFSTSNQTTSLSSAIEFWVEP